MRNDRLDETKAGIMIAGEKISNLRHADDHTLMEEIKEGLKSLLLKVKGESGEKKNGLKLNIKKKKRILRSWCPVPSVQGKQLGKQWKQWQTLFSWASKFTEEVDCSHEIKRHLLLGTKDMTNLDILLKSRVIT